MSSSHGSTEVGSRSGNKVCSDSNQQILYKTVRLSLILADVHCLVSTGACFKHGLCTDLSDAESVGQDPVHSVGLHLSPLKLEAVDPGSVLPQSAVGVVVKLWRVGLP